VSVHGPRHEAIADASPSLSPWTLFERWVADVKPAPSTVGRWRTVFQRLEADKPTDMQAWAEGLVSAERSPKTVRDIYVKACRIVFAWAIGKRLLKNNPFTGWRITVPKKTRTRETKAFTDVEANTILKAALAIQPRSKADAAKRWCPWLAAYSGARMGEITQLRGVDVVHHAMKLTPEAGTMKSRKPRSVPIHEHLIEQGFLEFVKASGDGPLFYNEAKKPAAADDPTNPPVARYSRARGRLGEWVRSLGISDAEVLPTHGFRHAFKATAHRAGLSEMVIDAIVGHAPASVGRAYGEPTLADKAAELAKFPRYRV
jgi:integrase